MVHARFIGLAGEVNSAMPVFTRSPSPQCAGEGDGGANVLILVSPTSVTNDVRESPPVVGWRSRRRLRQKSHRPPFKLTFPETREQHFDLRERAAQRRNNQQIWLRGARHRLFSLDLYDRAKWWADRALIAEWA